MTALQLSRRRLVGVAATGVAALAGCADSTEQESDARDQPPDPREGPPDGAITDVETHSLRRSGEEAFVFESDPVPEEGDDSPRRHGSNFLLTDPEAADEVTFTAEPEGTAAARDFLAETDYETETVAVYQRAFGECYERRLEYVEADDDEFSAQFCRQLRDATTPCSAGAASMEAIFLRVPRGYDDPPSSRSVGFRSSCYSDFWEDEA